MAGRKSAPEGASDDFLVNLNAGVPRNLGRRVRVQCTRDGQLLRDFITEALQERLRVEGRRGRK